MADERQAQRPRAGRVSRRLAIQVMLGGSFGLLLSAACAGPAPGSSSSTPGTAPKTGTVAPAVGTTAGSTTTAGAQPKQGGTLKVYADPGFNQFFDPQGAASLQSTSDATNSLLYEGLVELKPDGAIAPVLAESWTVAPDGKSYTFKIRQGVKFHNGRPMTSADFKNTFQRIQDPATNTGSRKAFSVVTGVDTPDPATLVLSLDQPYAPLLALLTDNSAAVVPLEEVQKGQFDRNPVGTGPFKFGGMVVNQSLTLDANRDYWRPGIPHLDHISYMVPPDPDAAILGLRAGDVDIIPDAAGSAFQSLKEDPQLTVNTGDATTIAWLFLNPKNHPAFKDVRVVQAVDWALDRKAITDLVLPGLATPATGGFLPASYWAGVKTPIYPAPDLAKAKQLLTDAGYGSGFQVTLLCSSATTNPHLSQAPQVVQQQLKPLGIDVTLNGIATSLDQEWPKGTFQATLWGTSGTPDPDQQFAFQFLPGGQRNFANFEDADMQALVVQARTTADPDQRAKLYEQAQQRLVAASTFVFLYNYNKFSVARNNVKGIVYNPQTKQWREARDFWLDNA
jgi:peptide/nickel transport system substrate-binding protein